MNKYQKLSIDLQHDNLTNTRPINENANCDTNKKAPSWHGETLRLCLCPCPGPVFVLVLAFIWVNVWGVWKNFSTHSNIYFFDILK